MAYHKNNQFLHNHPNLEIMRNLDKGHVIIDRGDWEEARRMYWEKTYKDIVPYYFQGYHANIKATNPKPQIKVFITKGGKFRAKIKEDSLAIPYEVTIGGDSWENGKGRKYEESIMRKCAKLRNKVGENFDDLNIPKERKQRIAVVTEFRQRYNMYVEGNRKNNIEYIWVYDVNSARGHRMDSYHIVYAGIDKRVLPEIQAILNDNIEATKRMAFDKLPIAVMTNKKYIFDNWVGECGEANQEYVWISKATDIRGRIFSKLMEVYGAAYIPDYIEVRNALLSYIRK